MSITLSTPASNLKKFRNANSAFQKTFRTPLADLHNFVSTIICLHSTTGGTLTIDEVVFEAAALRELLSRKNVQLPGMNNTRSLHDWSVDATGAEDISHLLLAAFSDQIDFLFVPTPRHYAIYADHDEFVTFFFAKRGHLASTAKRLAASGATVMSNYERRL